MLITTPQIKRSIAVAGALLAVAAPVASARPADAQPQPAAAPQTQPGSAAPSMADLAARREATAATGWQAANPGTTVVEVPGPQGDGGGLDPTSLIIGASIPLTFLLVEVGGKRVLRRRREGRIQHQLA